MSYVEHPTVTWWHLHLSKPERCIAQDASREPLIRRAKETPGALVTESMLTTAECAAKLQQVRVAREAAALEGV